MIAITIGLLVACSSVLGMPGPRPYALPQPRPGPLPVPQPGPSPFYTGAPVYGGAFEVGYPPIIDTAFVAPIATLAEPACVEDFYGYGGYGGYGLGYGSGYGVNLGGYGPGFGFGGMY